MELTHDFEVSVPVEQAWAVLTDVERIAPCLPGAQLQETVDDEYRGIVKVKVGPITAQYKGKATFVERDEAARRAVLHASGRDTRGQGNASATITAQLEPVAQGTRVQLLTDLSITGKVAQFGRGALADVSQKLLGQFVETLETTVLSADHSEPGPDVGGRGTGSGPGSEKVAEVEPIDLLDAAGAPVAKRVLPVFAVVFALVVFVAVRRRRRRRRA
jgi:carbon monoxide dehydrogenase subunit G